MKRQTALQMTGLGLLLVTESGCGSVDHEDDSHPSVYEMMTRDGHPADLPDIVDAHLDEIGMSPVKPIMQAGSGRGLTLYWYETAEGVPVCVSEKDEFYMIDYNVDCEIDSVVDYALEKKIQDLRAQNEELRERAQSLLEEIDRTLEDREEHGIGPEYESSPDE